jgi:hypothetical protein
MPDTPPGDRIRQALKLLADEVRERIERHPLGHLVAGRGEKLDLRLPVPTALRDGQLDKLSLAASDAVHDAIQALLSHTAVFQPGRVFCLRCQSATCEHSAPAGHRDVFIGYGGTGTPRFADFGQWLLRRRDPRVDLLYREPPQLLTVVSSEEELESELLPMFRQRESDYRIHGQVAAGWYQAPSAVRNGGNGSSHRQPLAVSFQIVSSRPHGHRRRFGINVLGTGPEGEPLEHLFDRLGQIPWGDPVRWAQTVLSGIESQLERSPRMPREVIDKRLDGLVQGLARRLDKGWRGRERRTHHAEQRHGEGDRPTRMALADLARATPENLLFDTRNQTLVVIGERGRAHVFSLAGKLVTSVRYNPDSIERRRDKGIWRRAAAAEVEAVRLRLQKSGDDPGGSDNPGISGQPARRSAAGRG